MVKSGSTRSASYSLLKRKIPSQINRLELTKKLQNLMKHEVFESIEHRLPLTQKLSANVKSIVYYAFTEMLNNAIDHSKSKQARISVEILNGDLIFHIRDLGIGIFANIKKYFSLEDEWAAAEHLLKGKQTTMRSRHSGQGIFFTSKIADRFEIHSHKTSLLFDNLKKDIALIERKSLGGTEVKFVIKCRSKKRLKDLFDRFSIADYKFDKSEVRLGLIDGQELVSRPQAKKLLMGLEDFDRIVFDFEGVSGLGQAFADEIFRVYATRYPNKVIETKNTNIAVQTMIRRAQANVLTS